MLFLLKVFVCVCCLFVGNELVCDAYHEARMEWRKRKTAIYDSRNMRLSIASVLMGIGVVLSTILIWL